MHKNLKRAWGHDMFDGPRHGGVALSSGPAKLVVSNLDFGVSNSETSSVPLLFETPKSRIEIINLAGPDDWPMAPRWVSQTFLDSRNIQGCHEKLSN